MLAKRIIPVLLYRGTTMVKGKQFDSWRSVGHIQQAARIHAMRGVDELIILDIEATPNEKKPNFELVKGICDGNFSPITVGGGIKSVEDARKLFNSGADKICTKSAFLDNPEFLEELADTFGSQAICIAIDYLKEEPGYAMQAANIAEEYGAGEIILTCMDFEGMMEGYDLKTLRRIATNAEIPVIAHGGCGNYEHMEQALDCGADAVAAGSMFLFTDNTPRGAAEYLKDKGFEVRL